VLNRKRNRQQGINSTESAMKAATGRAVKKSDPSTQLPFWRRRKRFRVLLSGFFNPLAAKRPKTQ
jgi:hypothetical protein